MSENRVKETPCAFYADSSDGKFQLNQYTTKKTLGQGAFGVVYLAVNAQTGEEYALKQFSKNRLRRRYRENQMNQMRSGRVSPVPGGRAVLGRPVSVNPPIGHARAGSLVLRGPFASGKLKEDADDDPLKLVRKEIAIYKKLAHRNIVRLYEVLDVPDNDAIFMVFELCTGGELMKISLDKPCEPFPEEKARHYFRELLLGIEYLHENQIVHRDIKPENLLLTADGQMKLADFGVSEIFERDNDMMTRSAGSPAFMAPEQISIEYHEYSGRLTDIWSMGVTLYCMCYGRLPFIGSTFAEMYEAIRNNTPNIPDDDPRLHDLLTRLLEKDPKKRINMSELREHPWVTDDGRCPLPTREENCQQIEVTEEDVANAVSSAKQLFNAAFFLSAVARLKRIKNRRSIGCTITPGEVQHILQHGITSPTSHDQTDENNEDTKASDTDGSPESSCGELLSGEDTADSTSTTQTSVSDAGEEGDVSATSTSYSDSLSVQVSEDLSQAVIDKLEIKSPEIILVPEQPDAPSEE